RRDDFRRHAFAAADAAHGVVGVFLTTVATEHACFPLFPGEAPVRASEPLMPARLAAGGGLRHDRRAVREPALPAAPRWHLLRQAVDRQSVRCARENDAAGACAAGANPCDSRGCPTCRAAPSAPPAPAAWQGCARRRT